MTFEEASRKYELPLKVFHRLRELGLVKGDPLVDGDIHAVEIVRALYGDRGLLRAQLAKFDRATREDLVRTAELAKWERYVVNRYRNHVTRDCGKLYVKQVADEISAARAECKRRAGWVMDIYLLRSPDVVEGT